ncbi:MULTISPECIES: ABC transporter ATP-binding protein [unclassified Moorena]|uniref:ABC transporter ATP-binding protein n=1 Tax=unclassified Moorena TaxID=2683338 RepID=UPI0013C084A7|nr:MULTISPECIES: ABC transporter ATP-binding protein [unclassified Moorena]NEO05904.1 ABC transporter ATP-binding protein [Moorena sp. SIO3I8]NEO18453.1 ABC transporter ATP-binding protein [Moorena sp. SIO4A5]NEP25437.1 ABC transporter ATP-binding protein [Moorena sp. SIO3I6]NEQ58514.1 ABC transporter ATP-binding protein [Moorena sp. SIO4A1]
MTSRSPGKQAAPTMRTQENDWRLFLRLVPYARRSKGPLLIAITLLIPLSVASAIQPLIVGQVISLIRQEERTWSFLLERSLSQSLNILITILLLTILIRLVFVGLQGFVVVKIGQKITAAIREDLFEHVTSLAVRFFDRTPVGKLITRLTSDVEALGDVFSTGAIGIVGDLLSMIVIAATMFLVQWQLASILVVMLLPVTAIIIYFQKQYRKANYKSREELSSLNAMLQENISGINIVQLFRREQYNAEMFRTVNQKYITEVDKTIFHDSAISATLEWISLVAIAAVLWSGGHFILKDHLSFGDLSAFILYAQRLFDPLRRFSEKFTMLQAGFTAIERISDIMNETIEIRDPEGLQVRRLQVASSPEFEGGKQDRKQSGDLPIKPPSSLNGDLAHHSSNLSFSNGYTEQPLNLKPSTLNGEICFEYVWFAYKEDEYVLKDLHFTIHPGEKVALVGPTGAGKSSIIRLLCRLYEPSQGRILVDGIDIRDLPQAELRRHIGVILQEGFLFAGDVKSNISLGETYSIEAIKTSAEVTNVASFIEKLPQSYDTQLRERGTNLSAGQKQLLAFARAAIRNPQILVLDEATASLDVATEALIQEALERLLQQRTAIIIAHRLSTIRNVDRILVLKRGELVESGSHEELLEQNGLYASLYKLQMLGD